MSLAFVFPGQGSQSVGMLSELAGQTQVIRTTFQEASDTLGYDLWDLVQNGPEEKLNSTEITQPALLTAGVAVWRAWQEQNGAAPVFLAGHSLGEYSALVCAEALNFSDAVSLVADRGRFMQEAVAVGTGSMAAVMGLDEDALTAVCEQAAEGAIISCANFNSPGQIVIAGEKLAVERAAELAKAAGAKRAIILSVSVPSHCALMKPAAERLQQRLNELEITTPKLPVIHNVDASGHSSPEEIRTALVEQLYKPVRWIDVVNTMAEQGVDAVVECGPGKVLAGLCKRINKSLDCKPVFDPDSLSKALGI